jgi:uncharacterized membrane protein HdeD (DUF308 family)
MDEEGDKDADRQHRRKNSALPLVGGVILVILGVMFLLQSIFHIGIVRFFWPVILIVVGIGLLFGRNRK